MGCPPALGEVHYLRGRRVNSANRLTYLRVLPSSLRRDSKSLPPNFCP